MNAALVLTDEEPQEQKRHPWRCSWKLVTNGKLLHTCNTLNRARDSHCQRCGRPYAQDSRQYTMDPGTGLAERVSLSEAVHEWSELAETARQLFAQLRAIEERAGLLFLDQRDRESIEVVSLHSRGPSHGIEFDQTDDILEYAERQIWGAIAGHSGIFRVMSNARAEEVNRQLDKEQLPQLTPANVQTWLANAQGSAEQLLREKVEEVFRWLRPNSNYKTNSPFEIGTKVVLEYMVGKAEPRCGWNVRVNYNRHQQLTSMETLFKTLDGKGQATDGWKSDLQKAIESSNPEDARGETPYFRFRAFRNGNLHLEFKRMDLVAKLNAVAGGKNLKGERRGH